MADYKSMYTTLYQKVTIAIDILQNAQQQTEEMYILAKENNLMLVPDKEKQAHSDTIEK